MSPSIAPTPPHRVITNKPPRADLLWALERGDIRPVDGPHAIVRRARADIPVDHATDLLALRCDHLLARHGLHKIADLEPHPPPAHDYPVRDGSMG